MSRGRHMKVCEFNPTDQTEKSKASDLFLRDTETGFYTCKKCSIVVKHRNNLTRHPPKCKGVTCKSFKCGTCDKEFTYQSKLKEHERSHTFSSFTCIYCCKVIKSETNFNKHVAKCSQIKIIEDNFLQWISPLRI